MTNCMFFPLERFAGHTAFITDGGRAFRYADLLSVSRGMSERLSVKSLAFCLCRNEAGALMGYVSLMENGIPTVMLDGARDKASLDRLIAIYEPGYLWLSDSRVPDFANGDVVFSAEGYSLIARKAPPVVLHPELALLLTTSGSTGSPKLVRLSRANLKSNAESIASYLQIDENERPVTSLPMYYSYGLSVINSHLIKGAAVLLTDRAVIQKEFWTFAREAHATSVSGVPYTYEILRRLRVFQMDLPDLKTMTQAGGRLNANTAKEYIQTAKEQGRRFYVMYGQTEATARMSYLPWESASEKYASVGITIPGGRFSIEDGKGREIEEAGMEGELVYRGANVSLGYAERREDLSKGDENQGVLHTGDLARRDADGFYYITGRMGRFVKVWGNRCNLDAVEELVRTIAADCACVGEDDLITVFTTDRGSETSVRKFLSERMRLNIRAFDVRVLDAIPRSASGKTSYSELQRMLH